MWVEAQPGEMLMWRVLLCFNAAEPDPEDLWVRGYLEQHGAEPKRTWSEEREGVPVKVLQFGDCYLRPFAPAIRELERRGLVAQAIGAFVEERPDLGGAVDRLPPDDRQAVIWTLAGEALEHEAAGQGENGGVAIDPEFVQRELSRLLAERAASGGA